MLQACWGTGKGYFNATQPPVEYNSVNALYRFKSIAYIVIPDKDNSQGIVKLVFSRKATELRYVCTQIGNLLSIVRYQKM